MACPAKDQVACHTSNFTPHTSHLTSHTSHLTPHTSHLTPHTLHLAPHPVLQRVQEALLISHVTPLLHILNYPIYAQPRAPLRVTLPARNVNDAAFGVEHRHSINLNRSLERAGCAAASKEQAP